MAARMFNDAKDAVINKLQGRAYHHNLLGESLADLLRKATAKSLVEPDEELNQLVVEIIQQEVASGKSSSDVASLLKQRLQMDNPQKQWLAVVLVGTVMQNCQAELASHQEEILTEVARVMTRPAKPDTEAGKKAKNAAKAVLRQHGRAGTSAFRAINQEYRPNAPPGQIGAPQEQSLVSNGPIPPYQGGATTFGGGRPGLGGDYGGAAPYPEGYPTQPGQIRARDPALVAVEQESISTEVARLIEQAKVNAELLNEMLVATDAPDDFERQLVRDLVTEVRELRLLFNPYLEQLGGIDDPAVEVLMCRALEAVDMLDEAIALEKDVGQNLLEATTNPHLGNSTNVASTVASVGPSYYGAAPPPAPQSGQANDLIALDDLADAMTVSTLGGSSVGGPPAAHDPFSASTSFYPPAPGGGFGDGLQHVPGSAAEKPTSAVPKSAFEQMFAQGQASQGTFNQLAGSGAQLGVGQPPNSFSPPPQPFPAHHQHQPGGSNFQQPPPFQQQQQKMPQDFEPPVFPVTPGFGVGSPATTTTRPGGPLSFGTSSLTAQQYGQPQQMFEPLRPQQGGVEARPWHQQQAQQPQQALSSPLGQTMAPSYPVVPSFAPQTFGQSAGFGAPSNPFAAGGASTQPASNNPFAGSSTASAPGGAQLGSVDAEWDLFFADRAAGTHTAAPAGQRDASHINADFDALVAKPTGAR